MTPESIASLRTNYQSEIARHQLAIRILDELGDRLSTTAVLSPGSLFYAFVDNREDLALLMSLAPKWSKSPYDDSIRYSAEVVGQEAPLGVHVSIFAKEGALPGTCKLVEVEYDIPAEPAREAKPPTKGKKMVLKCDTPGAVSSADDGHADPGPWSSGGASPDLPDAQPAAAEPVAAPANLDDEEIPL